MPRRPEVSQIQEALKFMLARRGLRLQDLATKLKISLPTAKRLLNQDDLSMDRVMEICDWLGMSFRDVVELASQQKTQYHLISLEQEVFLSTRQSHFAFLRALQKGESVEAVQQSNGLTSLDALKYLQDLETMGFVRRHEDDRLELVVKDGMDWRDDGPLRKAFMGKWINQCGEHFSQEGAVGSETVLEISQRKMSVETFRQMRGELDELSRKYAAISRLERELRKVDELQFYTCLFVGDGWVAPMWRVESLEPRRNR